MTIDKRKHAEWSDAVAAIHGWPGAPSPEAIEALIAAGDALAAEHATLVALVLEWVDSMRETFPDGLEDVAYSDDRIRLAEAALLAYRPTEGEQP